MSILSNKELLEKIVTESKSRIEVLIKMGFNTKSGNYKTLKKYLELYNINIDHFVKSGDWLKQHNGPIRKQHSIDEIFKLDSKAILTGSKRKEMLVKNGLKLYKCELCGQDENWKTGKIPFILDHINGNNKDNRIENLRIVCHNCDATLPTYMGRNRNNGDKLKDRKKRKQLEQFNIKRDIIINSNIDFNKHGWRLELAKLLNVTPQSCGKYLSKYVPEIWKTCFKHIDRK